MRATQSEGTARACIFLSCAAALIFFWRTLVPYYPSNDWLVWHVAAVWAWDLLWTVACLSAGDMLVRCALAEIELPALERLVLSMAVGVVLFVVAMFGFGALGLFRPALAVALPVAFILINARRLGAVVVKLHRLPRLKVAIGPVEAVLLTAGLLGTSVIYLGVMSPGAISTDAAWFHMTAADDYVREGRLVPFLADWAKALPQLTSILDTWAFLVPGLGVADHWMLGLHTEFVLFIFTLAGVVAMTRWLLRASAGYSLSFTAFYLFPSIFIYDSNLGGAADHVQAFFVLPLLLAVLRTVERPSPRMALLGGLCAGGAFETKVQAIYVVLPACALLAGRACWGLRHSVKEQTSSTIRPALLALPAFGGALLIAMAPHLLKNGRFYGNPVYPFMMNVFPASFPVMPDSSSLFYDHLAPVAHGSFVENARRALGVVFTFSFDVQNAHSAKKVPFIGSLFTLLLPIALIRRDARIAGAILVALAALFGWAYVFPTPRNLQTFLPLLVAVTSALMAEAWRSGALARMLLIALVTLQLIWGSDQIVSSAGGRLDDTMSLFRSGLEGNARTRFDGYFSDKRALARQLPKEAVLLLHTSYSQLGIHRKTLLDWPGFQGLIDYRPMQNARDVYDRLRELSITHIAISPQWPAHSRQEEAVFDAFLRRHASALGHMGSFDVFRMPRDRPPAEKPYQVLCLDTAGYADGVYPVKALDNLDDGQWTAKTPAIPISDEAPVEAVLQRVDVVILGHATVLASEAKATLAASFSTVARYAKYSVLVRQNVE